MPLLRITSDATRLDKLAADLERAVYAVDEDIYLQHVYSSHLVLAGAGHIENSVAHILSEYGRIHDNTTIKRFVEKTVSRNSSLNCNKIESISDQFNLDWWAKIKETTLESERDAVDSLKTLRDQIAHGGHNGTGFNTVKDYFDCAKIFVKKYSIVILGIRSKIVGAFTTWRSIRHRKLSPRLRPWVCFRYGEFFSIASFRQV